MKKLLLPLSMFFVGLMLVFSLNAQATPFQEGNNYKILDLEPSKTPIVTEFFSFYCPHCNTFEPVIQQLKTKLPEGVKLKKNHISFFGGDMGIPMSKAYATMVDLDVEDKMLPVMFNQIHNLRQAPKDERE